MAKLQNHLDCHKRDPFQPCARLLDGFAGFPRGTGFKRRLRACVLKTAALALAAAFAEALAPAAAAAAAAAAGLRLQAKAARLLESCEPKSVFGGRTACLQLCLLGPCELFQNSSLFPLFYLYLFFLYVWKINQAERGKCTSKPFFVSRSYGDAVECNV